MNEVRLTTSKNDHPIGIAANNSNVGEIVNIIALGRGDVKCTGSVTPGSRVQSSNTTGYAGAGLNSIKVLDTAITSCSSGQLEAIIHLE